MNRRLPFRILASFLAFVMIAFASPAFAGPVPGSMTGSVVAADGKAPVTGAIVHISDVATRAVISSAPTGTDGTFQIADVPAGTYEMGVQAGQELYLSPTPVTLAPGQARNVSLAVRPSAKSEPDAAGAGSPTGWNNPLVASLIVVGSAIVLGVIIDQATDDNGTSSPSQP